MLQKRYKIVPQMEYYDNLSCSYRPYTMFFNTENFRSKIVNTDENGFRLNFLDGHYLTNKDIITQKKEVNIVIGGSLVFGFGVTNDSKTISSNLSIKTGEIFLNYGGTAFNSMQELILFINNVEKIFKIKRIIIISGINDLYLSLTDSLNKYDNIFFNDKFNNVLSKKKKNLFQLFKKKNSKLISLQSSEIQLNVLSQRYRELFSLWKKISKGYNFDLIFFLQPFSKWFKKNLSKEEINLFNILDNSKDNAHLILKQLSDNHFYHKFAILINENLRLNNIKFFDLNQKLKKFDKDDNWFFVDRVHMTDYGHLIVSEEISNHL